MTTFSTNYGTVNAYAVAASLSAGNYDLTGTVYNNTTNKPADVLFEYAASVAANSSGNKQIVLYIQGSMDGTTWNALPTSVTDTTHDTSMRPIGTIPTNGGASAEVARTPAPFSIAAAFGGVMPAYWRVIPKNDCGVALTSCSARTQEVILTAA